MCSAAVSNEGVEGEDSGAVNSVAAGRQGEASNIEWQYFMCVGAGVRRELEPMEIGGLVVIVTAERTSIKGESDW